MTDGEGLLSKAKALDSNKKYGEGLLSKAKALDSNEG
jgi:hypothetical protein